VESDGYDERDNRNEVSISNDSGVAIFTAATSPSIMRQKTQDKCTPDD